MAEEQKGGNVEATAEQQNEEQFFINEDQFENVVPEFGTCGGGTDDTIDAVQTSADEEGKAGGTCGKEQCCKSSSTAATNCCDNSKTNNTASHHGQPQANSEESKVEGPAAIRNPCYKCKEKPSQYKNKQDVVCKGCLLWMLTHRFKNALVRYVRVQKDYPNLVAVSGGSNSMSMLHFLHCCLNGNTSQKKMFFKIHVLYIDEAAGVFGTPPEEAVRQRAVIEDACQRYGFTLTVLPIEKIYELSLDARNDVSEDMDAQKFKSLAETLPMNRVEELERPEKLAEYTQELQALLGSLEASFAADVCLFLKKWLIADFCIRYNFKRVFLGTTGHKIATQLLGQIAKGRGASIFSEVAYFDDKNFGGRVSFCNPMKEFLQKEIAIFNHVNEVPIIARLSLAQQRNQGVRQPPFFGSTDLLVEGFFKGLQAGYNVNTVPTVVRLANKLQKQDYTNGRLYPFCPLCLGPRDTVNNLLEIGSTIKSIKRGAEGEAPLIETVQTVDDLFASGSPDLPPVERAFCFGCKRLCMETKQEKRSTFITHLPQVIKDNAMRSLESDTMSTQP